MKTEQKIKARLEELKEELNSLKEEHAKYEEYEDYGEMELIEVQIQINLKVQEELYNLLLN